MSDAILDRARELMEWTRKQEPTTYGDSVIAVCTALLAADERARALAEALRGHIQALDDWLVTYASDHAGEDEVRAAYERIGAAGGTLAYIARLQEVARAALQECVE